MEDRTPPDDRSGLERALGLVTDVRAGEGPTALLLTLNVFLLLAGYYLIKPAREAFLLPFEGGAEYKAYMGGAIAVALLGAVPAYSAFANRVPRNRLVVVVTLFFASNLVLFWLASFVEPLPLWFALAFYLWVGVFNMMVVAQLWAFANDVYSEEQGKRLFPLVGLGASVGAAGGSWLGALLSGTIGAFAMLLVAAGVLVAVAAVVQAVHRRETRAGNPAYTADPTARPEAGRPRRSGAFAMVFQHRYLTLLAVFSLTFTVVNTNGEYVFSAIVSDAAERAEAAGELGGLSVGDWIGQVYSQFYLGVNVLGVLLQAFVVSRLVKFGGLRLAFFVLPFIALADAVAIAIAPVLLVVRIGKTLENATDYSVNNTVRNMLWLPTTQEMKYKAKQAVDTFFVRMGDVTSALAVFVLADQLGQGVRTFALLNIVVVVGWLALAAAILREQKRLKAKLAPADAP